jgi:hypothetical protein
MLTARFMLRVSLDRVCCHNDQKGSVVFWQAEKVSQSPGSCLIVPVLRWNEYTPKSGDPPQKFLKAHF